MKVIIAGGRNYNDYNILKKYCDYILKNSNNIEIVCGTAYGADKLGERYGIERGFKIKYFKPDWDKFKKSAGYIRNDEMAKYSDAAIVFWDEKSKGSKHMIDLSIKYKLKLRIFKFE